MNLLLPNVYELEMRHKKKREREKEMKRNFKEQETR